MASPTLKVEIAFTSEPLDTTPTWVDVSQYVRATSGGGGGVSISRGHGAEIGPFEAGACKVTLSNRDRRFDPSYSAGPNFGNLIPRKQIRITATWATVDYVQFTGWVTGWPQGFGAMGKDATVTIEGIDAIAMLANMSLERDLVFDYASTTIGNLALFLRQADVTQWSDVSGNTFGTVGFVMKATPAIGRGRTTNTLAPGMNSTAIAFDGSTYWGLNGSYSTSGPWSVSFWMTTAQTDQAFMLAGTDGTNTSLISMTPSAVTLATISVALNGSGASLLMDSSPIPINDGLGHHVVITYDDVSVSRIYVDGADVTATSGYTFALNTLVLTRIGLHTNGLLPFNGSIQDVAVWEKALTALEVEGMYDYSRGFWQESSADRVTRYLDDVGWPAAWREITTNPRASVGELVYGGASVLPKLQEVERSEQGMLSATKAGFIALRERFYANEVTVGAVVQQIFSDDGGATALAYSKFGFQYNDLDVTNDATVTTPTTWAKSSDTASKAVNGLQSKSVDTILSTFDQANDMAAGIVAKGKDATYRVPPIMSYPAHNTTRWDEVLGLELGYRVGIEQTPMGVGSQNAQEVTLEQIEWSVVDTLWTLTIAGSPCFGTAGVVAEVGWFTIGTSLIGGPDVIGY